MFAGLKKKLQEEGGSNIVAGGERKSATSNFGSSPKDLQTSYIHGEGHGTVHRHNGVESTTNNHGDGNKSHVQAEDGIADINGSREELIDLLTKRTKQVKTMEARLLELTSLLKEKNQMIEKLETALEKQQDVLCQRVQELNEQYNNCRIKAAETVAVAVRKKEEEMKVMFREVEKRNAQLEQLCKEQKVPQSNVEEQNGYSVEEFTHVKNLLLTTQHELELLKSQKGGESARISSVDGSSVEEITRLTSARLKLESDNQELNETVDRLKSQLKELQDKVQEVTTHSNMSQGDWLEKQIESENCISSLEDSVRSLKAELAQRDAEKSTFLKQLGDRADELSSIKSTLKAEQDRASQLQVTVDSHEAVTTCLQQRCQQSDSDCQDLKARLSQVTAELDECRCTLKTCRDEYSATLEKNKDTVASLNETISQLTEEVASLQQQISKLEEIRVEETAAVEADTTAKFRKELTALEDQIQDKNRVIKKQEQRLTDLKKLLQRELRVQPPADDVDFVASVVNSTAVKAAKPLDVTLAADTDGLHVDVSVAAAAAAASVHTFAVHSPPGVGDLDPSSPATLTVHEVGSRFMHQNSHFDHAAVLSPSGSSSTSQWPPMHERASNRTRRSSAHRYGTAATSGSSSGGTMMSPVDCEYDFMRELNFKYLRHVVLKFMLSREAEALQLIKAISMLLHFSPEEQKLIRDTLEWKKSWFGPRPQLPTHGQLAKVVPPSL